MEYEIKTLKLNNREDKVKVKKVSRETIIEIYIMKSS